jgi:hypothetical protein
MKHPREIAILFAGRSLGSLPAKMMYDPPISMHRFHSLIVSEDIVVAMLVLELIVVPEDQPLRRRGPVLIGIASQRKSPIPPWIAIESVLLDDQPLRRRGRIQG